MKEQNGIIKLCILMAFVSYFIWSNNEKEMPNQSMNVNTASSINQELNIKEGFNSKSEPHQVGLFQENYEISTNLILIHDELIKIGTFL